MLHRSTRDDGGPTSLAWMIFALLRALLLIALVSLVLDVYYRSNRPSGTLAVLDERYARGEITRAEYLQARADLGGRRPPRARRPPRSRRRRRAKRTPPAAAT